MTIFFAVVGAAVLLMFFGAAFIDACVSAWDRLQWLHKDHVAREIGRRIQSESYWYSENRPAMHALTAIGKALEESGSFRISESRDDWRRLLEADSKAKPGQGGGGA